MFLGNYFGELFSVGLLKLADDVVVGGLVGEVAFWILWWICNEDEIVKMCSGFSS